MALLNAGLTLFVVAITGLAYIAAATYRHRSRVLQLHKQRGIPMPKGWSWIWGHNLVFLEYSKRLPRLASFHLTQQQICNDFQDCEMYLLDLWPSYGPILGIFNPEAGHIVSTKYNLPKPDNFFEAVKPVIGGQTLLTMNGKDWKLWRSRFNPGFSAASLSEHIPFIIDCVQVFCEKLRSRSGGGITLLDELITSLTFDVITKVTLDVNAKSQREEHIVVKAFDTINRWHSFWDPRVLLHPLRPLVQWYWGNVLNKYIRDVLDRRFDDFKADQKASGSSNRRPKSIVSLALKAYLDEDPSRENDLVLNDEFARMVTYHVRLFLFAGNDTTSSSIGFTYHMIWKHPKVLVELQKEHEEIFGPDPSRAAALLKEQPSLLNRCRYTLAVVKETLRLYPPAVNIREGMSGVSIPKVNGDMVSTDGVFVLISHHASQKNPRIWPRPMEFIPERWLVEPGHELYPPAKAFRVFDVGPRTCIGQALSLNEMQIALVMTVRTFRIEPAYEEWDRLHDKRHGLWDKIGRWMHGEEMNTVNGDRAYQTEKAGTHPSDGYPCRISMLG